MTTSLENVQWVLFSFSHESSLSFLAQKPFKDSKESPETTLGSNVQFYPYFSFSSFLPQSNVPTEIKDLKKKLIWWRQTYPQYTHSLLINNGTWWALWGKKPKTVQRHQTEERCSKLEHFNKEAGGLRTWLTFQACSAGAWPAVGTSQPIVWAKRSTSGFYKRTAPVYSLRPPTAVRIHHIPSHVSQRASHTLFHLIMPPRIRRARRTPRLQEVQSACIRHYEDALSWC